MFQVRVQVQGALADGSAPGIIRQALQNSVQALIEMGDERLAAMARPRPGGVYLSYAEGGTSTGNYRRNMHSEVRELTALISDSGVVYGPWLEGIGSRNATTRFKGYAMFRRTSEWLNEQAPKVVQQQITRAIAKLEA